MAATLDEVVADIQRIPRDARENRFTQRPRWPMIVLRSLKGWTGPKTVDGKPVEGTFRAHQVAVTDFATHPEHIKILEQWMKSYRPEELFDVNGRLVAELTELAPKGERRMGANPHANGGLLLRDLKMPDFRDYAVTLPAPGAVRAEATRVQGELIRDVLKLNIEARNFRVFSPDETASNRWNAVFEVTNRCSTADLTAIDDHIAPDGRVMEMLSEHQCEGWLGGNLLTGRHGFFSCYEAFMHIVDSMFNQHAKHVRDRVRPQRGMHHGLQYGRRAADGYAHRGARSGRDSVPAAARADDRAGAPTAHLLPFRPARFVGGLR